MVLQMDLVSQSEKNAGELVAVRKRFEAFMREIDAHLLHLTKEGSPFSSRLILKEIVIERFDALEREVYLAKRALHHIVSSNGQG